MPANLSSFCCVKTTVRDAALPDTQEYYALHRDSIQSTDVKKKESPFRAKCHEIFCCPLKQVNHNENTDLEGLSAAPSAVLSVLVSVPPLLCCVLGDGAGGGGSLPSQCRALPPARGPVNLSPAVCLPALGPIPCPNTHA